MFGVTTHSRSTSRPSCSRPASWSSFTGLEGVPRIFCSALVSCRCLSYGRPFHIRSSFFFLFHHTRVPFRTAGCFCFGERRFSFRFLYRTTPHHTTLYCTIPECIVSDHVVPCHCSQIVPYQVSQRLHHTACDVPCCFRVGGGQCIWPLGTRSSRGPCCCIVHGG